MMLDSSKTYYLSHPLTSFGSLDYNYQSESLCVTEIYMKNRAVGLVRPLKCLPDARYANLDQADAMEKCIALLRICDGIILCPEWDRSAGCLEEFNYAKDEGKEIIYFDGFEFRMDA